MKKIKFILAIAAAVLSVQACGPKKGTADSVMTAGDSIAYRQKMDSVKAASDKVEREKARAERKRLADERKAKETYEVSGKTVYNRVEIKPQFKGGTDAMNRYFKDNLKYPQNAENLGWKGTVSVDFVVGEDGKVQYAEIAEDSDTDTEQVFKDEALRVVMAMPAWIPGNNHGKKISASYNLPIVFDGEQ